ncbi:MAG TPA: hypothetical protein GXX53_00475 [Tissierellia bacterium]|nr:hypothetical protein [Tissierellia bacterium]
MTMFIGYDGNIYSLGPSIQYSNLILSFIMVVAAVQACVMFVSQAKREK